MYWNVKVTPEDEHDMIKKIAENIHKREMDFAAIIMFESIKPVSFIGAQMGRFFLSPFLYVFGDNIGIEGAKFFQIFENRDNLKKLIKAIEELRCEKEELNKAEERAQKNSKTETGGTHNKKWWHRFLP